MNGRIIVAKPLYVALAQRKEDRKAHLAAQYMQRIAGMRMQQQMGQVRAVHSSVIVGSGRHGGVVEATRPNIALRSVSP